MLSYEDGLFRGLYMDGDVLLAIFAWTSKRRLWPARIKVTGDRAFVTLDGVAVRAA